MVLGGEEDQTMPLAATRLLAERIPNARFKAIPEVGHYYEIERPADFNEDLRAFLAELAPAA
jgi:3-oxoadipate enol-lactonase